MEFLDCRLSYGYAIDAKLLRPCPTLDELISRMKNAGLRGGVVYNIAADISGVQVGNQTLCDDLQAHKDCGLDLYGMYTIVPSYTHEVPAPEELPAIMRAQNMPVLRFNPDANRFLPGANILGDYLSMAQSRRIPVLLDTGKGLPLPTVDALMQAFPELSAILFFDNVWPCDRYLRSFLAQYPNLVLDTTHLIQDGVYEQVYEQYGSGRLVHGSGYPAGILGVNMLTLKFSALPQSEKAAIAGGTLRQMIKEADYR